MGSTPPLTIESFLARHPSVRIATAADNEELIRFYRQAEMDADGLSLSFNRGPDFFHHLNHHSDKSYVAIFKNEDGSIGGVASLCMRRNYLNGEEVNAAYLGDLRLSPTLSRATRLNWRMFYGDFLASAREISELGNCRYFYSVVLDQNKPAMHALIRRNGPIVYRPLAQYQTVSLIARWPRLFKRHQKSGLTIRRSTDADREALREFLAKQHRSKVFGQLFCNDPGRDEFGRRLDTWENFDLNSFWLAVDAHGAIQACVCPWTGASASRQLIVGRMPFHLKLLGRMLPLLGKRGLRTESELKILYLTPLEFAGDLSTEARSEILHDFLNAIYDSGQTKDFHLISFFDYTHNSLLKAVKNRGFLYQLTPATLYQVIHREFENSEGLGEIRGSELPGLDIGTA